ncbi:MAG: serine/threonine-protein kinase [Planctomycetota bacterium]|nr:serine/threonine-protein kinase [Planctomycetota bacterium]
MTPEERERLKELVAKAEEEAITSEQVDNWLRKNCPDDDLCRARAKSYILAQQRETKEILPQDIGEQVARSVMDPRALVGETLANYWVIVQWLGGGGMGDVYLAQNTKLPRIEAVKVLKPGLASVQDEKRFRDEAGFLAKLQHSNIAVIYDVNPFRLEKRSGWFFNMELVKGGKSITAFARASGLTIDEKIRLFLQLCDAIAYGHELGVCHRDIKPDNVLVDGAGVVKVIDFGVAHAARAADGKAGKQYPAGTIPYMSPEQAQGKLVNERTDVHAMGVLLFELVCGALPYDLPYDDKHFSIHDAIESLKTLKPRNPREFVPDLHQDLVRIMAKAMEKDQDKRYQSVTKLAEHLGLYLENVPIPGADFKTGVLVRSANHVRAWTKRHPVLTRVLIAGSAIGALSIPTGTIERFIVHNIDAPASILGLGGPRGVPVGATQLPHVHMIAADMAEVLDLVEQRGLPHPRALLAELHRHVSASRPTAIVWNLEFAADRPGGSDLAAAFSKFSRTDDTGGQFTETWVAATNWKVNPQTGLPSLDPMVLDAANWGSHVVSDNVLDWSSGGVTGAAGGGAAGAETDDDATSDQAIADDGPMDAGSGGEAAPEEAPPDGVMVDEEGGDPGPAGAIGGAANPPAAGGGRVWTLSGVRVELARFDALNNPTPSPALGAVIAHHRPPGLPHRITLVNELNVRIEYFREVPNAQDQVVHTVVVPFSALKSETVGSVDDGVNKDDRIAQRIIDRVPYPILASSTTPTITEAFAIAPGAGSPFAGKIVVIGPAVPPLEQGGYLESGVLGNLHATGAAINAMIAGAAPTRVPSDPTLLAFLAMGCAVGAGSTVDQHRRWRRLSLGFAVLVVLTFIHFAITGALMSGVGTVLGIAVAAIMSWLTPTRRASMTKTRVLSGAATIAMPPPQRTTRKKTPI